MTRQECFIAALEKTGHTRVYRDTRRYIVYTHPNQGFYWIGKSGSLRIGPTISRSHPAGERFKEYLISTVQQPKAAPKGLFNLSGGGS